MKLILCYLTLLVCGSYAQQNVGDLDDLIKDIFTTSPNPSTVPRVEPHGGGGDTQDGCDCVPYYQCNNNSLITDGVGLIDIR